MGVKTIIELIRLYLNNLDVLADKLDSATNRTKRKEQYKDLAEYIRMRVRDTREQIEELK